MYKIILGVIIGLAEKKFIDKTSLINNNKNEVNYYRFTLGIAMLIAKMIG